jgi:hypothetical protein
LKIPVELSVSLVIILKVRKRMTLLLQIWNVRNMKDTIVFMLFSSIYTWDELFQPPGTTHGGHGSYMPYKPYGKAQVEEVKCYISQWMQTLSSKNILDPVESLIV